MDYLDFNALWMILKDRRIDVKRIEVLLLLVLAVAVGLFGCYYFWIHEQIDKMGPVYTVEEEILEISVTDPKEALMRGIKAIDDRDGDVTASILVESISGINDRQETTVTYAAFDRAGNVSKLQRQIRYVDYRAPRFEAYTTLCFPGGKQFDFMDYVGATDVLEGDIRRRVHATLVSDTQNITMEGNHKVKLQVTNSLGDTSVVTIPVLVYSPEWYSASVELKENLIYLEKGAEFDPDGYLKTFVFRGTPIDISTEVPSDITVDIENDVKTDVPGVYTVTYILSKSLNSANHAGIAKLIVIVE